MEMMELLPSEVLPLIKFPHVCSENLDSVGAEATFMLGNFSSGENFAWVTKGPCIEVLHRHSGYRIGSWNFGAITKDPAIVVACVVEYSGSWEPLLLIGLHSCGIGMLCVFNPQKSKLVNAIELPTKVISLEVMRESYEPEVMISYLQKFSGIVVVGMASGLVYLLDLCLDRQNVSDETQPSKINAIPASMPQIQSIHESLDVNEHLAIILDNEAVSSGSYYYRKPDGKTMESFSAAHVCVTAVKYIPHTGSLIVGLNFGCFQVWKMDRLMLEFSSPYEADLAPVTHIVYQEPENDPKEVIYAWIGRGPTFVDKREGDCSALSLYQFSYDSKKALPHHGILYRGLQSVFHKFEYPLTTDPYNVNNVELAGSSLISCEVVMDAAYQRISRKDEGLDEHHQDLSLCAFLWEAALDLDSKPMYLLGLFDLNRWYHAQMPSSIRPSYLRNGVCPFFAFCNLEDIIETAGPQNILAAQICRESVTRYRSTVTPAPEQHFYPSALAFDLHCLQENSLMRIHFSGVQKQILTDLRKHNPAGVIEPTDMFSQCSRAEILPKFCESSSDTISDQRDALLSVFVENAMTDVILNCINSWADGEYSRSGCTLRVVLNAAWSRVVKAKECIDKNCVSLFDCSMTDVDKQTVSLLHQQESEMGRLCRVFQHLLNLSGTTTEQGAHDLQVKLNVTLLLHEYTQVLTWLVVVGLLPETVEGDDHSGKYNYPSESLPQAFGLRRQELLALHQDLAFTDLLMIDGLIDNIGTQVKDLWNKEGGNGLYPPPSLHAALGIYLLEDVPIHDKHCVFFYHLLDLISLASDKDQRLVQECSFFAQCFGLSPSLARLVQGFWLLDHRDYGEAVHVLLDPIVREQDLAAWQHTRIIKALLYQGEARNALVYATARLPNPTSAEDVKLTLTVLLASRNINQAFEYQRQKRNAYNCHDLIEHFFNGCQQTKNLGRLVQLPLDDFEDKQLCEFLRRSSARESMELLVMYYLQRGRYVQAIRLNDQIQKLRVIDTNPEVVQRAITRDAIIQAYLKNLPEVQRNLVKALKQEDVPMKTERIEVDKPKPLSTKVNNNANCAITSRATLICAVMEKVKEVEAIKSETSTSMDQDEEDLEVFVTAPATPKPKRPLSGAVPQTPPSVETNFSNLMKRTPLTTRSPMSKISESAKRRMLRYQNAEAISLLATPPVKRIPSSRVKKPQATPQSILKVRKTVQNQSPLVKIKPSENGERSARRNPFVSVSGSPHALKPGTPKLLRFVLSPSRSSSSTQLASRDAQVPEKESESPDKSTKDTTTCSQTVEVEVDEDITFNFNISQLRRDDAKMDTDDNSCPSTPSAVDDRGTPSPSPTKVDTKTAPTSSVQFASIATPREQVSLFIEDMDSDSSEREKSRLEESAEETRKTTPSSPYEPARKMLDEFRSSEEYRAASSFVEPNSPRKSDEESELSTTEDDDIVTDVKAPRIQPTADRFRGLGTDLNIIVKTEASEEKPKVMEVDVEKAMKEQRPPPREIKKKSPLTVKIEVGVKSEQITPESLTPPPLSPKSEPYVSPKYESPDLKASHSSDSADSDEPPVLEPMVKPKPRKVKSSPEVSPFPQSPRRSPRLAKKMSPDKRDQSPVKRERQSSPLSDDAFMMKVRQSGKGVRDQAPEASAEDLIRFTFSDPVSLSDGVSGPRTPLPEPFIFSPPVTRSRRKRQEDSSRSRRRLDSAGVAPITGTLMDTSVQDTTADQSLLDASLTRSATKKTRRKVSLVESSDSPINFVSPVAEASKSDDDPKSGPASKMKLRSRFKVVRPERKSVRLMKK